MRKSEWWNPEEKHEVPNTALRSVIVRRGFRQSRQERAEHNTRVAIRASMN